MYFLELYSTNILIIAYPNFFVTILHNFFHIIYDHFTRNSIYCKTIIFYVNQSVLCQLAVQRSKKIYLSTIQENSSHPQIHAKYCYLEYSQSLFPENNPRISKVSLPPDILHYPVGLQKAAAQHVA